MCTHLHTLLCAYRTLVNWSSVSTGTEPKRLNRLKQYPNNTQTDGPTVDIERERESKHTTPIIVVWFSCFTSFVCVIFTVCIYDYNTGSKMYTRHAADWFYNETNGNGNSQTKITPTKHTLHTFYSSFASMSLSYLHTHTMSFSVFHIITR